MRQGYASSNNYTVYYYITNLQGDVIRLVDVYGNTAAYYEYDPYGNAIQAAGSHATITPLRYHGYVYDNESGFYYLQSRYYDPKICRFINADEFASTGQDFIGFNMFAYCGNNPVSRFDSMGHDWWHWVAAAAVVAVAAVVVVATAGGAAPAITAVMLVANGVAAGSAATTVAAGVFIGSATALAASAYVAAMESESMDEFADHGESALFNTAAGGATYGMVAYGMEKSQHPPQCFVAGTLVLTERGSVPIEDITIGDTVWAWNEETGDVALKKVVETYVNETDELVHVFVNGEEIITTPEHPFYAPVKGWTEAAQLRAGDMLVLVNGEYVVVEMVQHEILEVPVTVYNFQVEDYHTYYVASGVLVHNMCRPQSPRKVSDQYIESNNIDAHKFKQQAGGVPSGQISKYDIYQDTANNHQLWVGSKNGKVWKETIYTFSDLIERWKKR